MAWYCSIHDRFHDLEPCVKCVEAHAKEVDAAVEALDNAKDALITSAFKRKDQEERQADGIYFYQMLEELADLAKKGPGR